MNNDYPTAADICKAGSKVNTQITNPTTTYCNFEAVRSIPRNTEDVPGWAKCCGWG